MLLLAALALTGCTIDKILAGKRVDAAQLERSLVIRQSTKADVERVLGTPFGVGGAQLPIHKAAHDLWSYYYLEGTSSDSREMFVYVYFNNDGKYDGYMWFSSLPE